jgi:hypothetical protein
MLSKSDIFVNYIEFQHCDLDLPQITIQNSQNLMMFGWFEIYAFDITKSFFKKSCNICHDSALFTITEVFIINNR